MINLSHSLDSLSERFSLDRDSRARERFSFRICNNVCGGSSSSTGSGAAGAAGAPSAGTKKSLVAGAGKDDNGPGLIWRANSLACGEDRIRWLNKIDAMCVARTTAGSSADVVEGAIARAWTRGVVGGGSELPAKQTKAQRNNIVHGARTFNREHALKNS